ncbi:hypothetical protein [Mixta intestinalis]|uniref:Uncharacterized protein n=1 Tax=Mixta intestinalis TaxID=1615494 RepID=A0A6P1PZQ0_9GAMM|nr:hypothetical protein [Mixta intestinalis]QHM71651.1 hypothetical protein C7M51_01942 [Mixta intestinalis]
MINTRWIAGVLLATCSMMAAAADASNPDEETVKADPASGFWSCHGTRLHMAPDLRSWQDLESGDVFTLYEEPELDDSKELAVKGMSYTYSSMRNPAVSKFFIVDKTGKNLYLRDDIKFFKTYRCKRDK